MQDQLFGAFNRAYLPEIIIRFTFHSYFTDFLANTGGNLSLSPLVSIEDAKKPFNQNQINTILGDKSILSVHINDFQI